MKENANSNLDEKIEKISKLIGEEIIVRLGVKKDGKPLILEVRSVPSKPKEVVECDDDTDYIS